ncbi:IS3 family transposase [Micromonospora echinaurantiaca]|uniref:IS3 family transposase n=1 Tax=Micromonospora echinaurantiaca TaxID=47857 RepID=UPI0037101A47
MIYPVVADLAAGGIAVAVACRVLEVSTSGYYDWRDRPMSRREAADQALGELIREVHQMSRGTYGSPRVHAELRLAAGVRCGRKRVERLMRHAGLQGVYRRRRRGCTVRDPHASPSADLVNRRFVAERPDALWVTDITQHRTQGGWVYCAVVLDVFARRVVGWSIADHLRSELVIDALDMARWRRRPVEGQTVVHSDHGTQYTSWAFGQRLRSAGLLGSMGSIGDCYDNSLVESFFGSMQLELLDRQPWATRQELANAIFEWIEAWYNPRRRHSSLGNLSPIDYERRHTPAATAA